MRTTEEADRQLEWRMAIMKCRIGAGKEDRWTDWEDYINCDREGEGEGTGIGEG